MMTKQIGYRQKYGGGEDSPSNYAIFMLYEKHKNLLKTQKHTLDANWNQIETIPIKHKIQEFSNS